MRHLLAIASLLTALTFATTAAADVPVVADAAKAKKCFKRRHGKKVPVKCRRKTPAAAIPPVAPAPPPPPSDPALAAEATAMLDGQMLHHFSMSDGGFAGDEMLNLCAGGGYEYVSPSVATDPVLVGAPKALEIGSWQITGAQRATDGSITAGLLLEPADGTSPHFATLSLSIASDRSVAAYVNGQRWYVGPSSLCAS